MAPALEARNVTYHRSGFVLVQKVSLCAHRGEVLAISGRPGSGIGSLFALLAGQLMPDLGRVLVDGVALGSGVGPWCGRDPRSVARGSREAMALLADPGDGDILLLDRVADDLRADRAHDLFDMARRRAREGAAVVAVTQSIVLAAQYADAVAVLATGRLLAWGPPAVVLHPAVRVLHAAAGADL